MREKLHEQLSALVDDELGRDEQPMLLRQLDADPALRAQLSRYQLISDGLCNHLPPQLDASFHEGIRAALQDEPAIHTAVKSESSAISHLFKPLAGLAVAASVAVVAVLSLQTVRDEGGVSGSSVVAMAPAPVASDYLRAEVKNPVAEMPRAQQDLDAYLVNHNEYAANRGMLPYVRLVSHEMTVTVDGEQ